MSESDCPTSETLRLMVEGRLEATAAADVTSHVDSCPKCLKQTQNFAAATSVSISEPISDTVPILDRPGFGSDADFAMSRSSSSSTGFTTQRNKKSPPVLAEGDVLGQYRILKPLGRGGMGEVFQARHEKLDRIVALKTLTHAQVASAESMERFDREMKAVARLDHPNIVRAFDANETDGVLYFVMEYLEGNSLARMLKNNGPLSVAQACNFAQQVAVGLEHIHQNNLIHRDIKPANLIVTPDGIVKILDLGLALLIDRSLSPTDLTQSGLVIGTPDFMANEQLEDMRTVDIRADVYSLGATLYAMLTGHGPFAGNVYQSTLKKIAAMATDEIPPVSKHRNDIPVGLVSVLERMLSREPDDRYQTPSEVATALQPFVDQQTPHKLARTAQPKSLKGMLSAAIIIAAIIAAVGVWKFGGTDTTPPAEQGETDIVEEPTEKLTPGFELSDPLPKLRSIADTLATAILAENSKTALSRLKPASDNTLRNYMIQSLAAAITDVDCVLDLADSTEPDVRAALLLSLAESELVIDAKHAKRLRNVYEDDSDSCVHSAARLILLRKGFADDVDVADQILKQRDIPCNGWYQSKTGHTMMIVSEPTTTFLGSSESELGRFSSDPLQDESQREVTIDYAFAVSSREVSHIQFYNSEPPKTGRKRPSVPDTAYGDCYWNQAAEYCNYLSALEGLDESQFCYEPVDNDEDYRIKPNAIRLSGYRMPTDEEWEVVARAGSSTARHFGRDAGLLPKYCFGNENTSGHAHERGLLLPNAFGLYDTLGNVSEWIHEAIPEGPRGLAYRLRGGSCWTATSGIRSAARYYVEWRHTSKRLGFRVARTILSTD